MSSREIINTGSDTHAFAHVWRSDQMLARQPEPACYFRSKQGSLAVWSRPGRLLRRAPQGDLHHRRRGCTAPRHQTPGARPRQAGDPR
jgi:hypothetical protein